MVWSDAYGICKKMDVDLQPTLNRISNGQRDSRYAQDGTTYRNASKPLLPSGVTYTEWVVPTNGRPGPGAQRIVTGSNGSIYYSYAHYTNWIRLK